MSVNEPRLILVCEPHLLGEGLERILTSLSGIDFIGSWPIDSGIPSRLSQQRPDILLIGDDERRSESVTRLIAQILEMFPELSIIRVSMQNNTLQVYSSQRMPARTASLLEVIRKVAVQLSLAQKESSQFDEETAHDQDNQT
jgi:hypothetical protein